MESPRLKLKKKVEKSKAMVVPFELNSSGICNTCNIVANEQHILVCYGCKKSCHADCQNTATYGTRSFVKQYKSLVRNGNGENFLFVCDHCLTKWETKEASTLEDQMAEVLHSVAQLTKEVAELKKERTDTPQPALPPAHNSKEGQGTASKPAPWSDPKHTSSILRENSKVTLCIKSDGSEIDVDKVKEVVTSNSIQISKTSINQKNGDMYVELPSDEQREKLIPLLQNATETGNAIVNVKTKCPVITIKNVPYVDENDFLDKVKAQNPGIKEKLEKGSEFSIVFNKVQEDIQRRSFGESGPVHHVVARVSGDIRDMLKANKDRLYIGCSSYRVYDRFYVKSCAKCHRFGHYHAECDSDPCCGYCGDEDHESKDCQAHHQKDQDKYHCVNCADAGKEGSGHSSHWHRCPTYLEQQKKIMKKIPYYAKNC